MKIEIDLKDILTDEFGDNEALAETIKRQIVDNLTNTLSKGINDKITKEIATLIDEEIKKVVVDQMPSLCNELIDKEYTVFDSWGSKKETTTLRNNLIKTLTREMVYKTSCYDSDKNYFTKNVDIIIGEKCAQFKELFDTKINELFVKEALVHATEKLKKTLGMDK